MQKNVDCSSKIHSINCLGLFLGEHPYGTRTEIKVAINKKINEQINILQGIRIDEFRYNMKIQSKELGKKIVTADKQTRELSGRLPQLYL